MLSRRTWRRYTPRAVAVVSELGRSTFRFYFFFEASVMKPIVELIQGQFPVVDSIYGERGHIERERRAARFRWAHVGWTTALERGSSVAVINERLSVVTIGRRALLELGIWKPVGHVARLLGARLVNRHRVDGVEQFQSERFNLCDLAGPARQTFVVGVKSEVIELSRAYCCVY